MLAKDNAPRNGFEILTTWVLLWQTAYEVDSHLAIIVNLRVSLA